jgi:hypothetical protein
LLGRGITKCHLFEKKKCKKAGRTFVENRCKNKVIKTRNSNPQG